MALNARHPLVQYLETSQDEELDALVCQQVNDLAEMARSPLESERMVAFLQRSNQLLTRLVKPRENA